MIEKAKATLKSVFGYDTFRPQQEEIISHVLNGKDSIVLMPTGGGKSMCFQIPAIQFKGTTLVISPLISLMKDQVEALKSNGISAAYFNSSQEEYEKQVIISQAKEGVYKLLYMAPETLFTALNGWLSYVDVSFVAIDEAHCVSMWGHDFRPEYTQLSQLRNYWPEIPYAALTATADKATRKEIATKLGLQAPKTFLSSFDRPNISLSVMGNLPKKKKQPEILSFIKQRANQSGIIYCLSRKETEEWSEFLSGNGVNCTYYHAGLTSKERSQVQEDFINDRIPVITATIAFGMGIDKSNVRWVIHNNLPKNIEGYYQEIGRAGRDGLPSEALLYYNMRDVKLLADFARESEHKAVLLEKLNRMLQFAETPTCRRKTLLSYFSETLEQDCGNCDVCQNPPSFFDSTIIAQKALSGIKRAKESIGINLLIQLLRGAQTFEVYDRKLQLLKTYGVGKEHSKEEWQHYITQLLNIGAIEIAYDHSFNLKITPYGERILFGQSKVMMAEYEKVTKSTKKQIDTKGKRVGDSDQLLFEELRSLRLSISKEEKVPPYIIFNDATLWDMVAKKPLDNAEFLEISGVGQRKMMTYGNEFMEVIKSFIKSRKKSKKNTYKVTYEYLMSGMNVEQIAKERELAETTIYSHLAKLYLDGKDVPIEKYVSKDEIESIQKVVNEIGETDQLKPIFELLDEQVHYGKIRMGLAYLQRNQESELLS